jgi:hypothetical protein
MVVELGRVANENRDNNSSTTMKNGEGTAGTRGYIRWDCVKVWMKWEIGYVTDQLLPQILIVLSDPEL